MPELDDQHNGGMPHDDLPNDDLMTSLFADVREETAGFIRPAGAAAAVATVRRRRRNQKIAGGVLALALVVGPVIGIAWANNRPDGTPDVADPTPSVSASASPSAPASPSAGPSGSVSPSILDPGIPANQLRNMTLTVPQWPGSLDESCPSGAVKFTGGKSARPPTGVELRFAGDPVYVDVNADGRNETVIRVDCPLQGLFTQVLAFSRNADGKVTTRGKVVGTHVEGADVKKVWKIEAGGTTSVRVDVGDYSPCCGVSADYPQHQWRTYGWDGQRFHQTGGPTSFPSNPKKADLGVSAGPLRMSAQGAAWSGRLTLTVVNKGPGTGVSPDVSLNFPAPVTLAGPDAGRCRKVDDGTNWSCGLNPIAPNASAQVRLDVTSATDVRGQTVDVILSNQDADRNEYPDDAGGNNTATVVIPTT